MPSVETVRSIPDRRLLLIALFVAAAIGFAVKAAARMPDFEVYWNAANHALAGDALYRPEDGHWLLKYLPAFAIVMIPFAFVPLQAAKAIWFFTTVAVTVLLIRTTLLLLPELRKPRWLLATGIVLVLGKFYVHELALGQTNLFLVAAVVAALLAMKRGHEALAGVLIVVAIVLKPYAVILLPWLLARWQRNSIAAAALGMIVTVVLPAVRYGFAAIVPLHLQWWQTVITSTEPNLLIPDNVSWLSTYSRWFGEGAVAQALTIVTALIVLAAVVYVYARRRTVAFPELLECSLLLTLMPLLSPQGWDYVLLVATPGIACLINYDDCLPRFARGITLAALAVIGLSIYDVVGRAVYRPFMQYSGITICFFVVIAALVALRQRRVA